MVAAEYLKELEKAILKVPEFMIFGNWDYKRCVFCKGPRKEHKANCVRGKLEEGVKK
ncbi:unnamed protein product [marine sediment metagenome]|uniref:Uncharacterized protein n=1 Tax=marine sediment metagenome TaxID=412755 RepID=X1C1M0_9ZZZZ